MTAASGVKYSTSDAMYCSPDMTSCDCLLYHKIEKILRDKIFDNEITDHNAI
jgi:hypothetical protein